MAFGNYKLGDRIVGRGGYGVWIITSINPGKCPNCNGDCIFGVKPFTVQCGMCAGRGEVTTYTVIRSNEPIAMEDGE